MNADMRIINQAREALATALASSSPSGATTVYDRYDAKQKLRDNADVYIAELLEHIDDLTAALKEADEASTRDDPAHDTPLEAAHHEAARWQRIASKCNEHATLLAQLAAKYARALHAADIPTDDEGLRKHLDRAEQALVNTTGE